MSPFAINTENFIFLRNKWKGQNLCRQLQQKFFFFFKYAGIQQGTVLTIWWMLCKSSVDLKNPHLTGQFVLSAFTNSK